MKTRSHMPFARYLSRVTTLAALTLFSLPAHAQQMVGGQLLNFASNYVIAPLGIFSVVVGLGASFFRPDMVRGAIYSAIICAVLFFIIRMAPSLMQAMQH